MKGSQGGLGTSQLEMPHWSSHVWMGLTLAEAACSMESNTDIADRMCIQMCGYSQSSWLHYFPRDVHLDVHLTMHLHSCPSQQSAKHDWRIESREHSVNRDISRAPGTSPNHKSGLKIAKTCSENVPPIETQKHHSVALHWQRHVVMHLSVGTNLLGNLGMLLSFCMCLSSNTCP